jgi:putative tRNA adenosine deaminase-associated protein
VSYFTTVLARDGRKWSAHDVDVEALSDLGELAAELRVVVADDDAPVLLLVEREDAWWGVVRVDGEDDPRVFVSDAAGAAASPYAGILDVVGDAAEDDDPDEDEVVLSGTCAGDLDVLADLGTSPEELQEMCDEELLPMDALAAVAEGAGFAEVLDSLR